MCMCTFLVAGVWALCTVSSFWKFRLRTTHACIVFDKIRGYPKIPNRIIFCFASICLYPKFTSGPKLLRCDTKERSYLSRPNLFHNELVPHRCLPISWDRKYTQSNSYWANDPRVKFSNDLCSTRARGHSFTGN